MTDEQIATMLKNGAKWKEIQATLQVSPSVVARVKRQLETLKQNESSESSESTTQRNAELRALWELVKLQLRKGKRPTQNAIVAQFEQRLFL